MFPVMEVKEIAAKGGPQESIITTRNHWFLRLDFMHRQKNYYGHYVQYWKIQHVDFKDIKQRQNTENKKIILEFFLIKQRPFHPWF